LNNGSQTLDGKIYYRGTNAATSTPYIIQELRRLAATSKTGKVTIIAHSNGGLLAKALLTHPEYAQYVDNLFWLLLRSLEHRRQLVPCCTALTKDFHQSDPYCFPTLTREFWDKIPQWYITFSHQIRIFNSPKILSSRLTQ
jgi:pimeloyl-ACP methyl ester carboxylesterase